ncbi:unnamed protein product [Adineta ricciae]|uniref:Uncharacterized protein n=1 Tax=Adineta ricciae TaxID=249248 RepID=A0A814QP80_ADIRI|nr:unnamed protein product [Adineta ricciae]
MIFIIILTFITINQFADCQFWNTTGEILPWESYLELGHIERPLGLTLNRSSIAHHHFSIGYLCLQSFMYDEAQDAFDLAINATPTFLEAYIGKMLACKHALWADTDFVCGLTAYNSAKTMLTTSNITPTTLQSLLFASVYEWFANESSVTAGELAFLSSIEKIAKVYTNETDIQVLYGLALLNVAYQSQYEGQLDPKPMIKSREVLKLALRKEPTHPGALHYLIHAYDVDRVTTAENATEFAITFNKTVLTLSHAQHMPAHIWMRIGAWLSAISADRTAIEVSFGLCATKILHQHVSISSSDLPSILMQFNSSNDVRSFLQCDAENRAHSTEWLSYSRLQAGDWLGSVSLLRDLFLAENQSSLTPLHYLPFAYRTQARSAAEIFFWFPYDNQFLDKLQSLLVFNKDQPLVLFGDNATGFYQIWSEAGYRFVDCLQLLTNFRSSNNKSDVFSTIDRHLARLDILSNRTIPFSRYVANNIQMMIPQIRGMRAFVNGSWQECFNELFTATQLESKVLSNGNNPTLIFARSSELLALHFLLMYEKYQDNMNSTNSFIYKLNGTEISVDKFPTLALDYYEKADKIAPNRAINTLGMARANAHLDRAHTATNLYRQLIFQMTSANYSDENFLQEANEFLEQHNSTINHTLSVMLIFLSLLSSFFALKLE